jgi:hypothetical protein
MQKFDVAEVGSGWGLALGLVKESGFYGELIYQVNHNNNVLYSKNLEAPHLRLTHLGGGRYDVDDVLARPPWRH